MKKYTNELIHETSPYLLQHAHNPVNWYPWGPKAFEKAKKENKMLIISIGYAACHWCHVMERESFMDEEVAQIMNNHFVCIKVDREERPDIDQIYMTAVQLISGNGGWPLNALALPDRKPFFAGTYFPKDRWIQLLTYFIHQYKTNYREIKEQAHQLANGIAENDIIAPPTESAIFTKEMAEEVAHKLHRQADKVHGGLSATVKFPMPSVWSFLLKRAVISGNDTDLELVNLTLTRMAKGGIFDQIGGGFARYTTDPLWHVPHFEKMLYDNAQLISLYAHAWQVTHNPLFRNTALSSIKFVIRELYSGEAFFASLDADSEGEEGKFYSWTYDEIHQVLGDSAILFCEYYGISKSGNWEHGKNIPDRNLMNPLAKEIQDAKTAQILDEALSTLLHEREKRTRPATDDKILTSWNALMAIAFADAYRAFGEEEYYDYAQKTIDFIISRMRNTDTGNLFRNFQKGRASVHAFLDDYAFTIAALIAFYQLSFDVNYLKIAKELTDYTLENFYDQRTGLFFYNDKDFNEIIVRTKELTDDVIPSSNSTMAHNLGALGQYFDDTAYTEKSVQMLKTLLSGILAHPAYYSNWAALLLREAYPQSEVAIIGNRWKKQLQALQQHYLPATTFCGSASDENLPLLESKYKQGKTLIYVCRNKSCQSPTEDVEEALKQVSVIPG
ncbi:MAG: thioredoxin domain-containing protein [Chitinophagaceae bacterium]|nr:thioredoxin domain-containing protein [Chitinophagaceae bacterium]MCO5285553.1 thioredoxin domain-containing protein [Chitinophagaceae bacterium]MCZ2395670.1 thioredoxin domain-containing protein [Chitinophagales bacterium]